MKIAVLSNGTEGGGAAVAAYRMTKAFRNSGMEADLFTPLSNKSDSFVKPLVNSGFNKKIFQFKRDLNYFLYKKTLQSAQFESSFSPAFSGIRINWEQTLAAYDLIHLHWVVQGFLSIKDIETIFALGKPVVWHMHDMWPITGGCHYTGTCNRFVDRCFNCPALYYKSESDIAGLQWKRKKELVLTYKPTMVGASEWLTNLAGGAYLGRKSLKCVHIPNTLDTEVFKPMDKIEARKKLGLQEDRLWILFTAMNVKDPRKGFGNLVKALKVLKEKSILKSKIGILIAGKTKETHGYLPFPVKILGSLSTEQEMALAYNAAELFVIPSLQDNLPNTVMEALSCGTPAVGFRIGGIPEMIQDTINGFIAKGVSPSLLSEAIENCLSGDQEDLRYNARRSVIKRYSEEVVAKHYLELFTDVLNAPREQATT